MKIDRGTYLIIRTDGREETVAKRPKLGAIKGEIGVETIDTVIVGRNPLLVMVVDDLGYETEAIDHGGGRMELRPTKALRPVNAKATALYHAVCAPGTTHQIVGDVAICNDDDFA